MILRVVCSTTPRVLTTRKLQILGLREPLNPLTGTEPALEPEDDLMLPTDVNFTVTVDMLHHVHSKKGFSPNQRL